MSAILNLNGVDPAATDGQVLGVWQKDPTPAGIDPTTGYPYYNASVEVANAGGVAAKTASYAATLADNGTLLSFNAATGVTLTLAGAWASGTYTIGHEILDSAGHIQKVTVGGTTGGSAPTFNNTGGTTTDSGVTWTDFGVFNKWRIAVQNIGVGLLTISPNGLQLDGSSSSITVANSDGTSIYCDGANYFTERGGSGNNAGGVVSLNTLTGSLTLLGGAGVTIAPSGSNITITAADNFTSGSGNIAGQASAVQVAYSGVYGSPVTAGNFLVAIVSGGGILSAPTFSDSMGNVWTTDLATTNIAGASVNVYIGHAIAGSSGANTVSASSSLSFQGISVFEFSITSPSYDTSTWAHFTSPSTSQNLTLTSTDLVITILRTWCSGNYFTRGSSQQILINTAGGNPSYAIQVGNLDAGVVTLAMAANGCSDFLLASIAYKQTVATVGYAGAIYVNLTSGALYGPRGTSGVYPFLGSLN